MTRTAPLTGPPFAQYNFTMTVKTVLGCFSLCTIALFGNSQNFEILPNVCDSLAPNSFLIHTSGYATFGDSMTLRVELISNDSTAQTVYSGHKDFFPEGTSSLNNFSYDPSSELFSLDIGTYTSRQYRIKLWAEVNGEIKEELLLYTF